MRQDHLLPEGVQEQPGHLRDPADKRQQSGPRPRSRRVKGRQHKATMTSTTNILVLSKTMESKIESMPRVLNFGMRSTYEQRMNLDWFEFKK